MSEDPLLQIGDAAEAVGLSMRTIRHYEDVGLVQPSERSAGGFRLYAARDVERLRLVKQLKPLDFTLDEMRDLLDVLDQLEAGDLAAKAHLVERLSLFATIAQVRCDQLREQLANAEALTAQLRRVVLQEHGAGG